VEDVVRTHTYGRFLSLPLLFCLEPIGHCSWAFDSCKERPRAGSESGGVEDHAQARASSPPSPVPAWRLRAPPIFSSERVYVSNLIAFPGRPRLILSITYLDPTIPLLALEY